MADDLSEALDRNIPLYEMIQQLRRELAASIEVARDEALQFQLEEVELELQVKISSGGKGEGGLKFWVVEAKGGGGRSSEDVHTFRLKLKPVLRDGQGTTGDVRVASTERRRPV